MSFGGISSDTIAEHSQVEDLEDLQDGAGGDGHGSDSSIDSKIPYMKAKHPAGTTRNLPTRSDSDNSIKDTGSDLALRPQTLDHWFHAQHLCGAQADLKVKYLPE